VFLKVVEAEGIAKGAPSEIKQDVAAHEAKVVAVAEDKILGAPADAVTVNTVLVEARSDAKKIENDLKAVCSVFFNCVTSLFFLFFKKTQTNR
jgi:hypothetical protein